MCSRCFGVPQTLQFSYLHLLRLSITMYMLSVWLLLQGWSDWVGGEHETSEGLSPGCTLWRGEEALRVSLHVGSMFDIPDTSMSMLECWIPMLPVMTWVASWKHSCVDRNGVMGFAIPSESDQIIQRKEQPQNEVGVAWKWGGSGLGPLLCLPHMYHTHCIHYNVLTVNMQQWLKVALGVAGKVRQKPSRYVQEHVQVGFSQLTNHFLFSSSLTNHLVHYIPCFMFPRRAGRAEVEKEYRRKVTSAPWDLLRSVILAVDWLHENTSSSQLSDWGSCCYSCHPGYSQIMV